MRRSDDGLDNGPPLLPLSILETVWPFFSERHSFIAQGFQFAGSIFRFKLLRDTVIVVSGERARTEFLTSKYLDINEGFKVLSGAIPMLPGVTSNLNTGVITLIHKRLSNAQSSERLENLIPYILSDIDRAVTTWSSDLIDPFAAIPTLCFQTSVRCLACHELADDASLVGRLRVLYDKLDTSTTPASVLLPWLPSPSMVTKLRASKKVYDIIDGAIRARLDSGISRDDTLQMLIDSGDDKLIIVGFIMGLLVAGARSTGTTASWLVTFLAEDIERRQKARDEIHALLSLHAYVIDNAKESVAELLSAIPLEAWEKGTPVLDKLIRETLRIAQPHAAMRRNMGPDIYVDGTCVPSGSYIVYPFSDVHLNSQLYVDPWRFDPDRAQVEGKYSYVGWGGGTTVCLGQRLAKLEMKLILAILLLRSDFTLVDRNGNCPTSAPRPNWNDHLHCKPTKACFVRFDEHKNC
ncbi:hypothetical protein PHLGIDRAFT_62450 [Phlebiopsis gigantea 11061_1 CR5-6]|uniref:Cytochrome P450 n=1 Tax=Phlebiopsis gigantea (strain 11061_1 CR5-6) TaxID=745531 RepID=A0A0C3S6Z5_PHLG1|nr:hypothetical protein PHLGIDRAFT_62450 [Phlebiopsis gigantea 11061_1 CR5-6]